MKPEIDTVLVLNEVGQQVPMKLLKPLYTADQLRAAQVAVLREAADWFSKKQHNEYANPDDELFRMADELTLPAALHETPKRGSQRGKKSNKMTDEQTATSPTKGDKT